MEDRMLIDDENVNSLNLPMINNKENTQKNFNEVKEQKPYSKNHIKVKLNPNVSNNNPINKGLNIIDQNNNCIKKSKNLGQEEVVNQPIKGLNRNALPDSKDEKEKEKKLNDILSKFTKIEIPILNRENINLLINKRESDSLLIKYGEECYYYNKALEKTIFKIPDTLLENHKITSVIRTKMVDWMIEVLSIFNCTDETFFLSVNIMDIFYQKTKKVYHNEDVHLIGLTSMFISSKFQEIYPLSLKTCVNRICHKTFNENDIKKMEYQILEDTGLEILVSTSVYDFLKTYFYDFFYNNKKLIKNNCDMGIYNMIKLTAKYLSKVVVHYEYFYQFENSMKAIGCIVTAIKLVGLYLKEKITQNERNIYSQWVLFLLEQDNFDKQKIETIVNKIYLIFNHYQKSKSISRNLNRFMKLPFMIENGQ